MVHKNDNSRRDFLKGFTTSLSAIATAKIGNLFPELKGANEIALQRQALSKLRLNEPFELFGGFILLPEDTPVPDFVAFPDFPAPIHCGVGDSNEVHVLATHDSFETVEEVVRQVNFGVYTVEGLPTTEFRLGDIVLTRHENGQVDQVLITYEQYLPDLESWVTTVSMSSRFTFPAPYPIFFTPISVIDDGKRDFPTLVEKVDYLPKGGLQISTAEGYVYHWMENSVFYTLTNELSYGGSIETLPSMLRLVK